MALDDVFLRKVAVKQRGFYFPSVRFSSKDAANNIMAAFTSHESNISLEDMGESFYALAVTLFAMLLSHQQLFLAMGDHDIAWQVITEEWKAWTPLSADLVREVVSVMMEGRRNYQNDNRQTTTLTDLVDRWIAVWESLAKKSAHVSYPWPPSNFNKVDVGFLAHSKISSVLNGITRANPGQAPRLPTSLATPWATRLFLCWVALVSSSSHKVLYMTPIAFGTSTERNDWYYFTGAQTKMLGTIDGFLAYASDAFGQGKTSVTGLVTKWFASQASIEPLVDILGDSETIWTECVRMKRFGTVITMRQIHRASMADPILQVIWFDTHRHYERVRKQFSADKNSLLQFNEYLGGHVMEWAKARNGAAGWAASIEVWWGGLKRNASAIGDAPDSMQLAAAFCREWIEGKDLPDDDASLRGLGFEKREAA